MADERTALLERAQLLQKARQIQASKRQGGGSALPDGIPTQPNFGEPGQMATADEAAANDHLQVGIDHPGQTALAALGAGAKGLDVGRGALTAPALAALLEQLTGKDVYRAKEHGDAINPTNLSTYPSSNELFERAGVPEGATLSDYMGGYAEGDENTPWYHPEKGGMLDPSVRGVGGFITDMALDPMNYISFGAAGAAKKAAGETASAVAREGMKKGMMSQGLRMGENAVNKVSEKMGAQALARKLAQTRAGQAVLKASTAPSDVVKATGKKVYNMMLRPVEEMGEKYGKHEVGDTLYNAGIMSPGGLKNKSQAVIDSLMGARDQILQDADDVIENLPEGMGYADMEEAVAPTRATIKRIRAERDPELQELADQLEAKIKTYTDLNPQAAHSEVAFKPKHENWIEMPQQNVAHTEIDIIPKKEEFVDLPQQGAWSQDVDIRRGRDRMLEVPNVGYFPMDPGAKIVRGAEKFEPVAPARALIEEGARVIPGKTKEMPSKNLISLINEGPQTIAGKEIPFKRGVKPSEASGYKTTLGLDVPESKRLDAALSGPWVDASKEFQGGMRTATEKSVGRNLGAKKAADLAELNAESGKLLTTQKAIAQAENVSDRALTMTGTDSIVASMGGAEKALLKKALETYRAKGLMPTGYMLRKIGEGQLTAPMIDALIRQNLKETAGRGSREVRKANGQEE